MKVKEVNQHIEEVFNIKERISLPSKEVIRFNESSFFTTMPIVIQEWDIAGLKVVRRSEQYCPTIKSEILVYDLVKGNLFMQIDGEEITTLRTSVLAYYSYLNYSVNNIVTISFIGLGNISKSILNLIFSNTVKRPKVIKLKKYKRQHIDFSKLIHQYDRTVEIIYCETYEGTVSDSDVVISAVTYFESDICTIEDLKDGCLVLPIHTRGFLSCDSNFDRVITDDLNHISHFQNFNDFKEVIEIEDIIKKRKKGRETEEEKIVVYTPGIVLLDIYFALKVVQEGMIK